jgi:hypothetical protein
MRVAFGALDSDVLRIAAESGRILVSHDRKTMPGHFTRVSRDTIESGTHHCFARSRHRRRHRDLLLIWLATNAEDWVEQLGFVPV